MRKNKDPFPDVIQNTKEVIYLSNKHLTASKHAAPIDIASKL